MEQEPESTAEESEGEEYVIEAQAQLADQVEEAVPEVIVEPVKQDISRLTKEYWSGPDGTRRWDLLYYCGLATIGLSFLNVFILPFFVLGEGGISGRWSYFEDTIALYFSGFLNSTSIVLGFVLLYTIHRDSAPPLLPKILLSLFLFWKVLIGSLFGLLAFSMSLMSELEGEAEESSGPLMNDGVGFYFLVIGSISLLFASFAFLVLRLGTRKRPFLYSILWVMCLLLALAKISVIFSGALEGPDSSASLLLNDDSHVVSLIDFLDFTAFSSILMLMFYVRGNLIPWKLPATLAVAGEMVESTPPPDEQSSAPKGFSNWLFDDNAINLKSFFLLKTTWVGLNQKKSLTLQLVSALECLWIVLCFALLLINLLFFVGIGGLFGPAMMLYSVHLVQVIFFKTLHNEGISVLQKGRHWARGLTGTKASSSEELAFPAGNLPSAIEPPRVWSPPPGLQGDEAVLAEFFGKRRDCYNAAPKNESLLDYLHNNRERFAISSYFEIPTAPTNLLQQWALPSGLRGNVHLDTTRQHIVETIINSPPDRNYVIIGEPGVGKTVLLFEVFDQLMARGPTGLLTTAAISDIHHRFDMRLFYDDIPENKALIQAIIERGTGGLILTSREVDWKGLPTEFQAMFDRLTVPLFSETEMRPLCEKMLAFSGVSYNGPAVEALVSYAEGSPIYVWSMVRELLHKGRRRLSQEYIQENATQGMTNYVSLLLQRLLKEGEEFRSGGLHALVCLEFLADYMEERTANSTYFNSVATSLSEPVKKVLGDGMDRATFLRILGYLSGEGQVIRFPHDTWVDVLRGAGALNPFRAELQVIEEEFIDTKIFQRTKEDAVTESWKTGSARYRDNPTRQKDFFLALADTLLRNFNISKLKALGVDVDFIQEVAASYSHLPLAAMLVSKLQAAQPSQVTNVINIQDSVISRSNIG